MGKWSEDEINTLRKLNAQGMGPKDISEVMPGRSYWAVKSKLTSLGLQMQAPQTEESILSDFEQQVLKMLESKEGKTIVDIADALDRGPRQITNMVKHLKARGYNIEVADGDIQKFYLSKEIRPSEPVTINIDNFFKGGRIKIGAVSDTHLGSIYERLDVLNALYDIFQREGISMVLHGGNIIEGEARWNKFELRDEAHGLEDQIKYFIEHYPQRDGITTYFICGDDHEGWYTQREKVDVGRMIELEARAKGRKDLRYLGYQEADIKLESKVGTAWLKLMHGGGGTAYALSYTPQKIIESFQEGEKPHILLLGHYHKAMAMYERGVHCVQLGCTQDQTRFMRKKKLKAHLGGYIIDFMQAEDGSINRFKTEFIPFFDRGFYEKMSIKTHEQTSKRNSRK